MIDNDDMVRGAIRLEAVMVFDYRRSARGPQQSIRRRVSPWRADEESFIGFDHNRDEIRRFRFDHMAMIEIDAADEYVQPND